MISLSWRLNERIHNTVRTNDDRRKMMNENHSEGENIAEKTAKSNE